MAEKTEKYREPRLPKESGPGSAPETPERQPLRQDGEPVRPGQEKDPEHPE